MSFIYTDLIYNMTAPREIVPVVLKFIKPKSVLDVGCGIGTWLKAFDENGITDYLGVDGDYVEHKLLKIPLNRFQAHDLSKAFDLGRKFDLAVSLEVAEHLPSEAADTFVESLVKHGDAILFSAAIPGQGGQNHLNEQWPEYWQKKFARFGFYFHDLIRPEIWDNEKADFWYRQNIFLVKRDKPSSPILSLVHPRLHELRMRGEKEYYRSLVEGRQGLRVSLIILKNAVKLKIKTLFDLIKG